MASIDLEKNSWWSYLAEDLQELLRESVLLLTKTGEWDKKFHDYSFIVFPAAKAYEGFLKNVFLDRGFIDEEQYFGKRFRIGKSLNPSLDKKYRDEGWVYKEVVDFCGGEDLAKSMWKTWKRCRNLVFHWFPKEKNALDYLEAKERLTQILDTIDKTFSGCKLEKIEKSH